MLTNPSHTGTHKSQFPYWFEAGVWLVYVCLYKYSYYADFMPVPHPHRSDFPYPQLILYALGMTLYVIPFYRLIAPRLLAKRRYGWLILCMILYFGIACKISNWVVSWVFQEAVSEPVLHAFYAKKFSLAQSVLSRVFGWEPNILFTDIIVFLSLAFMRFAFDNEQKKFQLEKDNLVLQLEALKAQLHPHFLFNTLNNIYGMSLTGHQDTPAFILKLSDMMRFILYDCQHNKVLLDKDMEFMANYLAMEKKRYPQADIQFSFAGEAGGRSIAPLLFIQFLENSFKHGAHRFNDTGFIHGQLTIDERSLSFTLRNDVFGPPADQTYGGVGIDNVKKRLDLYYPGQHSLSIQNENGIFEVNLSVSITAL